MKKAAATAAVFAVLPLLLLKTQWAYVVRLLGLMGLYMIIALGLNIVVGFLGMLDLGFAAFYAIGAYSMALLSMAGVGFWLALAASVLIAMAVRAALGAPVLRLARRLSGDRDAGLRRNHAHRAQQLGQRDQRPQRAVASHGDSAVKPIYFFRWVIAVV